MNNFILDFAEALTLLSIFSIVIYFLGHTFDSFVRIDRENRIQSFFVKMALGLISVVVIYSVYKTVFLTVFSGTLVSVIVFFIFYRDKLSFKIKNKISHIEPDIFFIYFFSLATITFFTVFLFHYDNRLFVHQDVAFYARLGSLFFDTGVEAIHSEPILYGDYILDYYHFGNEWLISLFLSFSNFTSLKILVLLVLPLLTSISFIGALNISNEYLPKISIFQKILLAFFFILIPGIFSFLLYLVANLSLITPYSILQGGIVILKVKFIVILLLLFFKDRRSAFIEENYFAFSIIPLFWNTLIPAFLGGYILYYLYLVFKRQKISYKLFSLLVLPVVFLQLRLTMVSNIYERASILNWNIPVYSLTDYIKDTYTNMNFVINTIIIYVLPVMILYLLIITYYDKAFNKIQKKIPGIDSTDKNRILILSLITISAFFSYGLLRELFNSRQILMNLHYPLINIILFMLFLYFYKKNAHTGLAFLSILFCCILLHAFIFRPAFQADQVLNNFAEIHKENTKLRFATDINSNRSPFTLYKKPYAEYLRYYEDYKPMRIDLIINTDNLLPKDKLEYYGSVLTQPFYQYVMNNKLDTDINSAKVQFIKKFDIDYLLVDSDIVLDHSSYIHKLDVDTLYNFDKDVFVLKLKK